MSKKIIQLNETKIDGVINKLRESITELEQTIDDLYYMDTEQLRQSFTITIDADLSPAEGFAPYQNFLNHFNIEDYNIVFIDFYQFLIIFRDKSDAATFKMWFGC
jgi:hypothetical protein